MSEMQFVDGLRAFKPSDKAPAHIKAKLTINRDEMARWLAAARTDDGGNIRVELRESKGGKYYLCVDNYQPRAAELRAPIERPTGGGWVPASDKPASQVAGDAQEAMPF